MKKKYVFIFSLCCFVLTGCGGGLPDCSDSDVIKLLKNIVKDSASDPFTGQSVVTLEIIPKSTLETS